MTTTATLSEAQSAQSRRLAFSFNARISFPTGGDQQGLLDGISLFSEAEALGFDTGWVYQRHFDNYLASPLTFLSVVGQHTERIKLGTAIIAIRYEDPILLAEAAATADLLTGQRLKIGIGTGTGEFDRVFGHDVSDARAEAQRRLTRFLSAIRGEVVGNVDSERSGVEVGTPLWVRPHSDSLIERVYYGSTNIATGERTAQQGLGLLLGTIITESEGLPFPEYHAAIIDRYRASYSHSTPAKTAVSRSVLPARTKELAAKYSHYDEQRRTLGPAASRPPGALEPKGSLPPGFVMSPVYHGHPDQVLEALLNDPGVAASEELVLFLPPEFTAAENIRLLEDFASTVAPTLQRERQRTGGTP